uniref:SWIM-type domain-containing protein n=1 Tax=Lactuca sativa TaxID=4236 RepID=A0A9R1WRK4_LACSA|nr:hypothetical protein LSAT_V11C100046620 [Lactuca sativa]
MVESNPTVPLRSIQDHVQKMLQVGVSIHKVHREKATTTKQVTGDYTKQYEVLRDYLMELQPTNVGTSVKLEVVNEPNSAIETWQFKRVYISLGELKKGFKAGLRDILGLDDDFIKDPFPGQVLTTVVLASNNGIYPLAYAIVETENMSSWKCKFDKDAFEWLKKTPFNIGPEVIFRQSRIKYIAQLFVQFFNNKLSHGRNKPIISCLEYIRQYLMKRFCNVKKVVSKAPGPLTPTTSKLLERNREALVQNRARWNGTAKYEFYGPWYDHHVVDMTNTSCTCRRWELKGIPCRHAIATIHEMADIRDNVGELYTYVNKVYWLQTWNEAYSYTVDPIKRRTMLPKSTYPFQLTQPPHHIQSGDQRSREREV